MVPVRESCRVTRATHRKDCEEKVEPADFRLTCCFVDRDYRHEGLAEAALRGAPELIAASGGGIVEGYPYDTGGEKVNASFLDNGTRGMFEEAGFTYERPKAKNHCVMRTTVDVP